MPIFFPLTSSMFPICGFEMIAHELPLVTEAGTFTVMHRAEEPAINGTTVEYVALRRGHRKRLPSKRRLEGEDDLVSRDECIDGRARTREPIRREDGA
jgi:hypothetical protein